MAYKLSRLQYKDVSFDKEVKALLKYLSNGWEISANPIGYDESQDLPGLSRPGRPG